MAVVPLRSNAFHHLRVAYTYHLIPNLSTDTMTCDLLHIAHDTTIRSLIRESIPQCGSYRMSGEMLYMGSKMKKLMLITSIRMYGRHSELSVCQRTSLVKYHHRHLRQHVHIVGSLDEDSLARGSSDTAKERQRHTDDQGTGTTDHEEHQRPIEPCCEMTTKKRWDNSQRKSHKYHDWCIDTGEAGDEGFALRLMLPSMLHKTDDL